MNIGGLSLFERMHCNHKPSKSFLIAAWHPKWSLTWSWSFNWSPYYPHGKKKIFFIRTNRQSGFYFHSGLNLPAIGFFHFNTQPTMKK
jgi:hypothetical protein